MKKIMLILVCCSGHVFASNAQVALIAKYLSSKLIRAIDLKVQQLQNDAINLTVLQKKLENRFSQNSLAEIASWEQRQKDLYAGYFEEMENVKGSLSLIGRINEVMQQQKLLVTDTKRAIRLIYADTHFTAAEAAQFNAVCESLLNDCAANLSAMLQMLTAGRFSMRDGERLSGLMLITDEVEMSSGKLNRCLQMARELAITRERDAAEIKNIQKLYGFR